MRPDEITTWFSQPRDERVRNLSLVVEELANGYYTRAQARAEQHRLRTRAYIASQESSVTARDREAQAASLAITLQLHEIDGEIAALEAARDLLVLLIGLP